MAALRRMKLTLGLSYDWWSGPCSSERESRLVLRETQAEAKEKVEHLLCFM